MMLAALCVLGVGLLLAAWAMRLAIRVRRLRRSVERLHRRLHEQRLIAVARREAQDKQKRIEDAVEQGTSSIEAIHRAVADISFDLWGAEGQRLREIHGRTADQIYGGIRIANRLAGRALSRLLGSDREEDR